jgi:hypothetical protein
MFERDGALLRQVNRSYRSEYDHLIASGLYNALCDDGLLVRHEEGPDTPLDPVESYKVLRPELVPFVSYPYEWCFSALRDAALLTLAVQRRALEFGMSLKDASAYNVQFKGGRPVFIDTLSFEPYREGAPWVAYCQFCQHFLAPLALMSLIDVRLNQLCRTQIDGIPLDLASRLLPRRSWLRPALAMHLHVHAMFQPRGAEQGGRQNRGAGRSPAHGQFSRSALQGLLDSLGSAIQRLRWEPPRSTWSDYYQENTYTDAAAQQKAQLISSYLDKAAPAVVWDLGANTGAYSRLASGRGISTVSFDLDPSCVERNYRTMKQRGDAALLPLVLDLLNPSPASGWRSEERMSLVDRGSADMLFALALVHHLAIAGNLPLGQIAEFFHRLGHWLVIEYVPPDDPQARRLLDARQGVCHEYNRERFEQCFQEYFLILESERLSDSDRRVYLMHRRDQRERHPG